WVLRDRFGRSTRGLSRQRAVLRVERERGGVEPLREEGRPEAVDPTAVDADERVRVFPLVTPHLVGAVVEVAEALGRALVQRDLDGSLECCGDPRVQALASGRLACR